MEATRTKNLRICATKGFNDKFGGLEAKLYSSIVKALFERYPYDMFVFETKENQAGQMVMSVRLAGYKFPEQAELNESLVVYKAESLETETFWCKIDDYGDKYVATFLFPSEY